MAIPTKTIAVRLFEYGGPDKLIFGEYDLPLLGARDVLVKNFAGSVSRWDVKYRAGDLARYQLPGRATFPLPQQLGREAAGASGGMGQATMQLCKFAGARVIATTRHPGKVAMLRELGADAVVVTADAERARADVLAFTAGEGVDHAIDYTGSPELLRYLGSVMRLGGRLVISSEQGHEPMPFTAADMIRLELNLLGIRGARMNDMLAVLKLLGDGRINTRIAARFPLARVGEAHTLLETSPDLVGRIVVLPWA